MDLDDEELKATRKLNGSDKNVGSIEEDIKILEVENYYLEELGYLRENNHFIKFNQALKNLIKAYKELKEENKILKGNYYTLCVDIQMVTSELGFPEDTIIADEFVSMIKENYIEKSLVEEKIEELNNRIEKYREYAEQGIETDVEWVDNVADRKTVKVLQELLEKRK